MRKIQSYFWVQFGSLKSGSMQYNYLSLIWSQGLKWAPGWAGIAFWLSCFGLNCAQMARERVESDFGLQGWIDTLGLKQSLFQQVSELWRISYKLTKEFAHPEFRGPLRVASTTKARLENFKINMPLINALCTPGIKDRHWEAMSVKVQYSLSDIEIVNITIFIQRFLNKAFEDVVGCAQVFPIELLER